MKLKQANQPTRLKQSLVILGLFAFWRLGLFLVAYLAPRFLAYKPSFPYADMLAQSGLPAWLFSFANFDGVHCLTIARQGYKGVGLIQAFFPVFPLSLRLGIRLGIDPIIFGVALSSLATLATLYLINATLKQWGFIWPKRLVTIFAFLVFPGSLFLGALYTEGLFLLWVWLNLYLVAKKRYFLASLVAGIASATRIVGVFLVIPPVLAYLNETCFLKLKFSFKNLKASLKLYLNQCLLQVKKRPKTPFVAIFLTLIGGLGLFVYMFYLFKNFHDPLYFWHVQNEFGLGKEEKIVLYPQVAWRALKILVTVHVYNLKYFAYLQEFLWGTFGLVLILLTLSLKKVPFYVFLLSLMFFLLPTTAGTFSSMVRYIMLAPSIPLGFLAIYNRSRLLSFLIFAVIIGLLAINTAMFIQGYWVA